MRRAADILVGFDNSKNRFAIFVVHLFERTLEAMLRIPCVVHPAIIT